MAKGRARALWAPPLATLLPGNINPLDYININIAHSILFAACSEARLNIFTNFINTKYDENTIPI